MIVSSSERCIFFFRILENTVSRDNPEEVTEKTVADDVRSHDARLQRVVQMERSWGCDSIGDDANNLEIRLRNIYCGNIYHPVLAVPPITTMGCLSS